MISHPIRFGLLALVVWTLAGPTALAHVTMDPKEAVPGYQTFNVKVPTERPVPTTGLRLVVPEGVTVTGILPVPGWTHAETREGSNETVSQNNNVSHEVPSQRIIEISWSGGQIQPGEYMIFGVSVKYDGEPRTLVWKAYQTYANGEVVAWDDTLPEKQPAPKVNMVETSKLDILAQRIAEKNQAIDPTWVSVTAFLLSLSALALHSKRKK